MKNLLYMLMLTCSVQLFSQVAIGKSSVTNNSVSLEFGNVTGGVQKGLLLPWVSTVAGLPDASYTGMQGTVVPGTMIFDLNNNRVKYMKSAGWFDLSTATGSVTSGTTFSGTGVQDSSLTDQPSAQAIIGASSSAAPGILVLEDSARAMVLPLVDKYTNIVNPSPGMIVFDTTSNLFCVYNGTVWSFWTY